MTTIKLKNGSGAPAGGDLVQGEPALDLTNKRLYTEDSGGNVIEVGTNPGVDVTFADNRKAIFGAGSDLQIYHDGSNSFIDDQGTGSLVLQSNGAYTLIQNSSGVANARFDSAGAASLRYNGAEKLATTSTGIDVTGTVTADGLTVDGATTTNIDGSNYTFSGTDYDVHLLVGSAGGGVRLGEDSVTHNSVIGTTGTNDLDIVTYNGSAWGKRARFNNNGDISFYEDTGTTAKLFWDASAESLGIGTTSPSRQLSIYGTNDGYMSFNGGRTGNHEFVIGTDSVGFVIYDETLDTYRLVIDQDSGNVGIGTSSPSAKLAVVGTTKVGEGVASNTSKLMVNTVSGTAAGIQLFQDGVESWIIQNPASTTALTFGNSGTERMRIDSSGSCRWTPDGTTQAMTLDASGNLLVGTTDTFPVGSGDTTAGIALTAGGHIYAQALNSVPVVLSRRGDDGVISLFRKDGVDVGSIGVGDNDNLYITGGAGSTKGLIFTDDKIIAGANGYNFQDDNTTLGHPSYRFKDLYLSNAVKFGSQDALATDGTSTYVKSGSAIYFQPANTTKMLLDSSGNLLVGGTSYPDGTDTNWGVNQGGVQASSRNTTATAVHYTFYNSNGAVGSISTNGSATSYNQSSDQRLKENIVDAPSASDDIDAIQVRSFDWKADGSHQKYGMVAQELQSVAPEAVSVGETEEDMMGVDYSKLVPMLVKEIQSLRARVAQLETN